MVLYGYFDESGTHDDSDAVSVAGYVSTAEQWTVFDQEWSGALQEGGLPHFHMTEFSSRAKQPYNTWTDQDRRFRFARLATIINTHPICSVGYAIPKKEFDQTFTKRAKHFAGGAYGIAATCCFMEAAELLKQQYPSASIAYVFEKGARGAGEVKKVFEWNHADRKSREELQLESLTFATKSCTPLQAADILSYEFYPHLPHQVGIKPPPNPRSADLTLLAECKLRSWKRLDPPELQKWAEITDVAAGYHGPSGKMRRERASR